MANVECPQVQTDRRQPLRWPIWSSLVGQNPYSNLGESVKEAVHIRNLDDIRLKWPVGN